MPDLFDNDLMWIAQRHGQDWCDDAVLAAADWLESLVPSVDWRARAATVERRFQTAKAASTAGARTGTRSASALAARAMRGRSGLQVSGWAIGRTRYRVRRGALWS